MFPVNPEFQIANPGLTISGLRNSGLEKIHRGGGKGHLEVEVGVNFSGPEFLSLEFVNSEFAI